MRWTTKDIPSQLGRRVIITGASGGPGYETALAVAAAGTNVLLTGCTPAKGAAASRRIRAAVPDASISYDDLDLVDLGAGEAFTNRLTGSRDAIDLLVNTAGVMRPTRRRDQGTDGGKLH